MFKIASTICTTFIIKRYSSTIFALSSGYGKCGVAVIRVSGPHASKALKQITKLSELPKPRNAILRSIRNVKTNDVLDKGLVIWFPGPKSFTGDDSFELHVHGGLAVVNSVFNSLGSIENLRLAEPGEFTRRAFQNGKLDLTEVEGLADLLQAETEAQRKQAYLQTQGVLSKLYHKWRKTLIHCTANIEAYIDFDETETIELGLIQTVTNHVTELKHDIKKHLSDGRKGETLRNGVRTVILGEPNVGKSSLLNLLCQRPAAIVTPISGTTRDIIEVTLNISGYPLILADTAGLKSDTSDVVEKEGIARALQTYKNADLIILVIDFEKYLIYTINNSNASFEKYLKYYINSLNLNDLLKFSNGKTLFEKDCVVVVNKIDLDANNILKVDSCNVVELSCRTESGVAKLIDELSWRLKELCGEPTAEHPSMNQIRHRQHLSDCVKSIDRYLSEATKDPDCIDVVIMAEYLRKSVYHLGKLVGSVTNDEILDIIFSNFCIGK